LPALGLALAILMAVGCGGSELQISSSVKGSLVYRERIALPPGAIARVALLDVSKADVPAEVLAETSIRGPFQVPIEFEIAYDASRIDPVHRYAIRAQIFANESLLFSTTENHPVITHGAPDSLEILLRSVVGGESGARETDASTTIRPTRLEGTAWLLEDLTGRGVMDILQSTVRFETGGRVGGMAGCNQFTGSYTVRGDSLHLGPLAATQKMCPESVMDQESRFLDLLSKVDRYLIDDVGFLVLYAPEEAPTRLSPREER
jgi:putative lipoprotein